MYQETKLLSPKDAAYMVQEILHEVRKVVVGKDIVILKVLMAKRVSAPYVENNGKGPSVTVFPKEDSS